MNLDTLDPRFTTVLCDVWGVLHDGGSLFPGVKSRLLRWSEEGRRVVLLTNAPRPASRIEYDLRAMGLPREAWHAVVSSGAAGIAALVNPQRPVGFLGTDEDRVDLESNGVILTDGDFAEIAAAGLDEWHHTMADYRQDLAAWRDRDVLFHCLNPDRVVVHLGERYVCPGALADEYEAMGGRVAWYGKPFAPIYDYALKVAGDPPRDTVLAIGDSLQTDMAGAAAQGIDAIFVTGGIHAGEEFPSGFGARHGQPGWRPLAIVETIA
nr:TIGR01459 family HAD-type hydrolase [uncultured Sphingomonas sp.]